MKKLLRVITCLLFLTFSQNAMMAQQSVAREWNEALLNAIRIDIGRPTVHARNLWHTSVVMYDAWAALQDEAKPYLLGNTHGDFVCPFDGITIPTDPNQLEAARDEAISYAAYRLLSHRFQNSPGAVASQANFDQLMSDLGYSTSFTSTDYSGGSAAALGNYIAQKMIEFGLQDNSNEEENYAAEGYEPVNPSLNPNDSGTTLTDLNRWQPLSFAPDTETPFLNPHWGQVAPFSLRQNQLEIFERDGTDYWVYLDPGTPPQHHSDVPGLDDDYKWNFALVAVWSGHLDPEDGVMLDISPASLGGILSIPGTMPEIRNFYDFLDGGVNDIGFDMNPVTGEPYAEQVVPLGDFGRVLAEFWADGPNSETPPGHWFTILNYVNDHPDFEKRFKGEGPILDDLEWDVKAYFALAGAIHDVAVAVWGIKSWHDFIRPISAIRGMAQLGQSSDPNLPSYDAGGLPLIDGHIALVESGDPLAGENDENVGKIKLYAWRGPDHVIDPDTDHAGVDWILADNWWPYQRPSFVTPPFAGYVSGHSTFSRAAAEVLTFITGSEYFPAGLGEFHAPQNNYLVFENGPSVDMTLQWARYRDASDQASLSRLWGGIHPPIDDCPGRLIGIQIGNQAFELAEDYFTDMVVDISAPVTKTPSFALDQNEPNPFVSQTNIQFTLDHPQQVRLVVRDLLGQEVAVLLDAYQAAGTHTVQWDRSPGNNQSVVPGLYFYSLENVKAGTQITRKLVVK